MKRDILNESLSKRPMKNMVLYALKDVLLTEKYESCADLINIAMEFGASKDDVYYLLEDPRRNPT
ncbi:MAG: hypothetical protein Q8Q33_07040 [Chlamydiota bacterium]|nr:hypothetical protein [Chlamydiota bacterium]